MAIRAGSLHVRQEHVKVVDALHDLVFVKRGSLHLFRLWRRLLVQRHPIVRAALLIFHFHHPPYKLLCILYICIDFVLLQNLSVLRQILLIHFLDLSLQLVFLFIQQLHVRPDEFFNIEIIVPSAA